MHVFERDGVALVNSRDVARMFGKRHDNVLQVIDALISTSLHLRKCGWFRETESETAGGNGATLIGRSFDLTRDGFALLVMGFTGEKALSFKVRYIEAFNAMEAALQRDVLPLRQMVVKEAAAWKHNYRSGINGSGRVA